MRIAKVIGTVTLNRRHPTMAGARLKLAVPLSLDNLTGASTAEAEEVVAYDELGAGVGNLIAISEGREAAMPFHPEVRPIDCYNAAVLDAVQVNRTQLD
jgi:microcompartment protein CcmK/EutM